MQTDGKGSTAKGIYWEGQLRGNGSTGSIYGWEGALHGKKLSWYGSLSGIVTLAGPASEL